MAALHAVCFTTPRPWSEAEFTVQLADPLTLCLTSPNGFLLGRVVAGEAEVLTLAVHPDARRQGIARNLLDRFHAQACRRNATEVFLEVAADNIPAVQLYHAAHYATAGRRRGYYTHASGPPTDALILRKPLTAP